MSFLDEHAGEYLAAYNRKARGQRYNRIASDVYKARHAIRDPLSHEFESHIIEGLKGFDMARTMKAGFADRLRRCLDNVRAESAMPTLKDRELSGTDLTAYASVILCAYNYLAVPGALDAEKQSHVAATKILHWLFPDLFLIVDSNVAPAFRIHFGVKLSNSTQPGYSSDTYLICLRKAQNEICSFGSKRFRELEPETPEARISDKIAFAVGAGSAAIS